MPRLFVAVDLPESARRTLADLCFGIPGAKWIEPEQIHLTLTFIGEVDGGMFRDILDSLEEIGGQPFDLVLKGVGVFPPRRDPRVLWVGVEKSEGLTILKGRVDAALKRAGFMPENRKYAPHITLARLKNAPGSRIGNFLAGNNLLELPPFPVTEFHLYSSVLNSKGAIHTVEASYPLE